MKITLTNEDEVEFISLQHSSTNLKSLTLKLDPFKDRQQNFEFILQAEVYDELINHIKHVFNLVPAREDKDGS